MAKWISEIRFGPHGLVPAIVQDGNTVLMVAYMNRRALVLTARTGYAHFFSRSRNKLWKKGEESGHVQKVVEIRTDCYGNSILLLVRQKGPGACHTGHRSCFYRKVKGGRLVVTDRVRFDPLKVYGKGK
jgi:phosphoribosyl-AMP cyclohydrolase